MVPSSASGCPTEKEFYHPSTAEMRLRLRKRFDAPTLIVALDDLNETNLLDGSLVQDEEGSVMSGGRSSRIERRNPVAQSTRR